MTRAPRTSFVGATFVGLMLGAAACDRAPPPGPGPDVALILDGIEIRKDELTEYVHYLGTTGERLGEILRTSVALDRHVIPMHLARRAFPAERAAQRERAEAMKRSVVASGDAYPQLRSKGELLGGEATPGKLARHQMELAQAIWCFDEANLGWVSPVLEVPQGFCLLAVQDMVQGPTRTEDGVDAYLVPFYVLDRGKFDAWYLEQKKLLADRLDHVHPDYVDALPAWITRPAWLKRPR